MFFHGEPPAMVKSGKAALAATVPLRKLRRVICMQGLDFVVSFAIQGTPHFRKTLPLLYGRPAAILPLSMKTQAPVSQAEDQSGGTTECGTKPTFSPRIAYKDCRSAVD